MADECVNCDREAKAQQAVGRLIETQAELTAAQAALASAKRENAVLKERNKRLLNAVKYTNN